MAKVWLYEFDHPLNICLRIDRYYGGGRPALRPLTDAQFTHQWCSIDCILCTVLALEMRNGDPEITHGDDTLMCRVNFPRRQYWFLAHIWDFAR